MSDLYKRNTFLSDADLQKMKEAMINYMESQKDYDPEFYQKEKAFWNALESKPPEEQNQLIYARFVQDQKTPEVQKMKIALYKKNKEANKEYGPTFKEEFARTMASESNLPVVKKTMTHAEQKMTQAERERLRYEGEANGPKAITKHFLNFKK